MKKTYQNIFLSIFILGVAVLSYTYFSNYKPKTLAQIGEVRGYRTIEANSLNLPYPDGSEKIGITRSGISEQITFQVNQENNKIHEYYKNILLSKNWEMENENLMDDFSLGKYELGDKSVTVLVLDQNTDGGIKSSLVSIEIAGDDL